MEAFYRAQHPRLLRHAMRRVGERAGAEDVCQDIWRLFFRKFEKFLTEYDDPSQALYAIARTCIADFWKKRPGRQELVVEHEDLAGLVEAVRPLLADITDPLRLDLEKALAGLPERQRQALRLHHLEDLTVPTTAAEMGISVNTVKKLLKRAMAMLRTMPSMDSYRPATVPQEVRQ
ncbi:RNA polymerase sigma factor (plasmid) [Streptomyces sp. AHU1]|uniref:RNA polymerase sigma factor n=1 Tax=Streptomyces sp. AHU1 TaxID=3377215 RepID=UPI003877FFAB